MKTKAPSFVGFLVFLSLIVLGVTVILGIVELMPRHRAVDGQQIKVVDGCEYIVNYTYPHSPVLTHKGNCTNIIHRSFTPER